MMVANQSRWVGRGGIAFLLSLTVHAGLGLLVLGLPGRAARHPLSPPLLDAVAIAEDVPPSGARRGALTIKHRAPTQCARHGPRPQENHLNPATVRLTDPLLSPPVLVAPSV